MATPMALPPLDFGSSASSALNTSGSLFHASGDGDWVVNFGGAGSTAGGFPSLALLALAAGVLWVMFKR